VDVKELIYNIHVPFYHWILNVTVNIVYLCMLVYCLRCLWLMKTSGLDLKNMIPPIRNKKNGYNIIKNTHLYNKTSYAEDLLNIVSFFYQASPRLAKEYCFSSPRLKFNDIFGTIIPLVRISDSNHSLVNIYLHSASWHKCHPYKACYKSWGDIMWSYIIYIEWFS
jgi:hypothetical protein